MCVKMYPSDELTLIVQGKPLQCSRRDLINNSDYFLAMFEGNFSEKDKSTVKLNDVDLIPMEIILKMIVSKDNEFCELQDEDVAFEVLKVAIMLQFLEIQEKCIEALIQAISIQSAIKIWLKIEQFEGVDQQKVIDRAKLFCLMEIEAIIDNYKETLYELDLNSFANLIGNRDLQTENDLEALELAISWFSSNEALLLDGGDHDKSEISTRLLRCINFKLISEEELTKISTNQDLDNFETVQNILKSIKTLKSGIDILILDDDNDQPDSDLPRQLLKSLERNFKGYPCFLLETVTMKKDKNLSEPQPSNSKAVVVYDNKYERERKRKSEILEKTGANSTFMYFDLKTLKFEKLCSVDYEILANWEGFKVFGYKQYIYVVGGEYSLGRGNWNYVISTYDTVHGTWSQEVKLPHPRRHFEACICGRDLFIVGGTGPFRITQRNILWCNLETKIWYDKVDFPSQALQTRCCSYKNELFLLSLNNKHGYLLTPTTRRWAIFEIRGDCDKLPTGNQNIALFSHNSSIYVKEKYLIEMKFIDSELKIVTSIDLTANYNWYQCESILCGDFLYTLAKAQTRRDNRETITFEIFDLNRLEVAYQFEKDIDAPTIEIDNVLYKFKSNLTLINAFHPSIIRDDNLIN